VWLLASLNAGEMAKPPTSSRRRKRFISGTKEVSSGRSATIGRSVLREAREDLIPILTKLTKDVERFDSMVANQRKTIEPWPGELSVPDDEHAGSQTKRLRDGAEEMLTSARQALTQLRRMSEAPGPRVRPS
jgi:hypothetical protein